MKQEQHTRTCKTLSFLAALAIACIFITAAIADDSEKVDELFSRGVEAYKAQNYEEAIKYFEAVFKVNPNHTSTHYNLGLAYANLGRYAEAVEAYKQAIRINPNDSYAHYNLGLIYGKRGHYAGAEETYKQAIRINPDYAAAGVHPLSWTAGGQS